MAIDIRELFKPDAVGAQWNEASSNAIPYLGSSLFPSRKKAGLDLRWLKGSKGLPISLMPSAFDAKATFRDRIGVQITETEMPFFREGFHIKEKDRQELLRVNEATDPYAAEVISRIFDDANNLIDGALVVPERMIMQLLFSGKINIEANGVLYDYNYGTLETAELKDTACWDKSETANPFNDLKTAKDKITEKTGVTLTRAIMNTTTFNLLAACSAIRNRIITVSGQPYSIITDGEVRNIIQATSQIQIAIYDKQYKDEKGVAHKFVPDNYVALIPDGTLGNTWFGTTPEEADLMAANTGAEVSIVNTGVALTRIISTHPVNITTLASEIVLPSFERMDECYLLKVVQDP